MPLRQRKEIQEMLRESRLMAKDFVEDRFEKKKEQGRLGDMRRKNMTKEQVSEIAGTPYYQNIQLDEKRGVETWLYRKVDGGAAAFYFKMKTDKMYNKNFDAVKLKVVE